MLRKIEALRKEPKEVRNRYAFWVAFLFTAVITVFWLTSIPARMSTLSGVVPAEKTEGGFSRMFQNMKASVSDSVPTAPTFTEEQEGTEEDAGTINFETFFQATTTKKTPAQEGRPVLIGTTSRAQSTSTAL